MIRRTLVMALLLITAAVLETALFPSLTLFGFRPDLLLLVTAVVATRDGPMAGARVGAAAGLLGDLMVASAPVGLGVLVTSVLGALVGWSRPYLAPSSVTAPLLLVAAASVAGTAAYGVLVGLLVEDRPGAELVVQAAVAVGLYNTLLSPLAYTLIRRIGDTFPLRGAGFE